MKQPISIPKENFIEILNALKFAKNRLRNLPALSARDAMKQISNAIEKADKMLVEGHEENILS